MSEELFRCAAEACEHGTITGARVHPPELLDRLDAVATPEAQAWGWLLRAQHAALSRAGDGALEVPAHVLSTSTSRDVVRRGLPILARLALLAFDATRLERCCELHDLLRDESASDAAAIAATLARAWLRWLRAEPHEHAVDLGAIAAQARALGQPALVVEAQALRALDALAAGDLQAAAELGRRASRMARTEGIPESEVLANVALARVRRAQNRPHLSLRILGALLPHAPPAWHDWIHWEAVAAGLIRLDLPGSSSPAALLAATLRAIGSGVAADVGPCAERLLGAVQAIAPLRHDARRALTLLVPGYAEPDPDVDEWHRGTSVETPVGLAGIAFAPAPGRVEAGTCAHVVVAPGVAARRVAPLAVPMESASAEIDPRPATPPGQPRTDEGLAVLALAGRALETPAYFRAVYEYDYEPGAHATMLGMHVHRMRSRLGDAGTIAREAGALELVAARAMLLRDPRCGEPLAQQTLRLLARGGAVSARALATTLGVPLRTMQRVLAELVTDGDLARVQEGREVAYRVEDTTFSEPTRSQRFGPAGFSVE
ncbi:hypothetical protein DB32_006135 [Sandaracinus amylolyticus]|uniref:Uncharacterized protein n=1 Tax=Sandaracinus amylolyticus TaxID=927083 RepID=A0A0F6W6Y0_9BACT|nr:hypothetical protein DB32_006135 [Sandaracinus amylolyticus]